MTTHKAQTVRLSTKGQLVIPRAIREALNWKPGTELVVVAAGPGVIIQPKTAKSGKRFEDLIGFVRYKGPRVPDDALCAPVNYREEREGSEKHDR